MAETNDPVDARPQDSSPASLTRSHDSSFTTRIRRLITALSLASFDRFDAEAAEINPQEEDDLGMLEGVLQLFIDELAVARVTTERALNDSERARVELEGRLRTIQEQRETIAELSSPVIDLWEDVVMLPIIGTVDSQRAAYISERLLAAVADRKAHSVLLDLTGVLVVDTATASHLVRLGQAVRLLGAECIFVGIGPAVAQSLATLGVEWKGMPTLRSLHEGLRYALTRGADGMDDS